MPFEHRELTQPERMEGTDTKATPPSRVEAQASSQASADSATLAPAFAHQVRGNI
jgi:hypothetical protein